MSVPGPLPLARPPSEHLPALPDNIRMAAALTARSLQCVAFWVATLLPFAYLPLVVMEDVVMAHRAGFAALLGLHAVAFVVGHSYNRPE